MFHVNVNYDLAQIRHDELLKEAAENRVIRQARKARYARSGLGYRFISAGASLFRDAHESPHVA
jgi:hypothetical protein